MYFSNKALAQRCWDDAYSIASHGYHEEAIKHYSEAARLDKTRASTYYNRGCSWQHLRRWEEAIKDYFTALSLNRELDEAYCGIAMCRQMQGRFRDAIDYYDIAIKREPDYAQIYYYRGVAKRKLGWLIGARKDISKAASLDSRYAEKSQIE